MLTRWCGLLVVLLLTSPALANGKVAPKKTVPPAVPGFVRFHQDDKSKAAEGGHLLQGTLHCMQCHLPKQPDGILESFKPAPILDNVGTRVRRSYLAEFLRDPHKTKPGTTMPNLFIGMDEGEKKAKIEALVHFLTPTGITQVRPDGKGITAGRDLYAKVGCVACHGTRDAKGDQETLFATSVPLGNLKAKYSLASMKTFLENPHQTRPHGRMPGIVVGKEASDIANYLMQGTVAGVSAQNMKYAYYEGAWKNVPDFAKLKPKASGDATDFEISVARRTNDCALRFEGFLLIPTDGDYTFYTSSDDGSKLWIDDKVVVNNDGVHPPQEKSGKTKLSKGAHKVVVGVFNAGGGFELSVEFEGPGEGRQNLGPRIVPSPEPVKAIGGPADADTQNLPPAGNLAVKGKEYFTSMGCANCHQLQDEKKRLNVTGWEDLKAENGCLSVEPKKGVPWYGLSTSQQSALQTSLKKPQGILDAKAIVAHTMTHFNCYACHERDKVGGVTDDIKKHFTATFKEWGDEASIPPSLTGVGAKLNAAYFKKILEQGSHDRTYMNTRMPKFGALTTHLVDRFASMDEPAKGPTVAFTDPVKKVKAAGQQMVGKQAFNCVNCHNFGGVKTQGVQGMDMAIMTERLKKEWFHNYLVNPTKYRAGTRMPSSFPEGKSPLKNVLDGKADVQIEAIWTYLADGNKAALPSGLSKGKASIPLIPITEAIIYRNFIQGAGTRAIAVGYPERAHLAFDANDMRMAMIWQGAFMDAGRHWTGRGEGSEPPAGDNVMNLPAGVSFFVLAKNDELWPTAKAKDLGYKFRGYLLADDERPTFQYSFNEIKIDEFPNAVETKGGNPSLRRTFTLDTANPIDKLYYRAAVADKIVAEKDGWFRINEWRMRIEADAMPVIRLSGKKMELLVPIQFKGNRAKLLQEYVW